MPLRFCNGSPLVVLVGRKVCTDVPQVTSFQNGDILASYDSKMPSTKSSSSVTTTKGIVLDHWACFLMKPLFGFIQVIHRHQADRVIRQANTPRSYWVSTPSGTIRRNRQHPNPIPTTSSPDTSDGTYPEDTGNGNDADPTKRTGQRTIMTQLRTGAQVRAPD